MAEFNLDDFIAAIPEGKGNLNKNGQKKMDTHPDYRGYLRLNGIVYEIGGWIKQTANGKSKMNLSIKQYVPKTTPAAAPQPSFQPKARYQDDNDVPF
jgi:hypothetical protein